MKINFLHASEYALISNDSRLTIVSIFDKIFAPSLPTVKEFSLSINMTTDIGPRILSVAIVDPKGNALPDFKWEANPTEKKPNIGTIIRLEIPLTEYGEYKVSVKSDNKEVDAYLFTVVKPQ